MESNALAGAMQGTAAFANSGLYLGRLPLVDAWQAQRVLVPLALLGSLGLPVLMEIYDAVLGRRALSEHAVSVLVGTAVLYLAATGLFFVFSNGTAPGVFDGSKRALQASLDGGGVQPDGGIGADPSPGDGRRGDAVGHAAVDGCGSQFGEQRGRAQPSGPR